MATDDEVRRLILEVVGEDKIRSLRKQIDEEKESLIALMKTFPELTAEEIKNDKAVQVATQHLVQLNRELKAARSSQVNFGYAAIEAARGIEDLQYGFAGVVNNIPGFVAAIGGPTGAVAAISLLGVAINQIIIHWDDLMGLFSERSKVPEATDNVKRLSSQLSSVNEEIRDLEKNTSLSTRQLERYNDLVFNAAAAERELNEEKKKRADLERLEGPTEDEAGRGAAFVSGAKGLGEPIIKSLVATGMSREQAERTVQLATQGEEISLEETLKAMSTVEARKLGISKGIVPHIRAGMPEFKREVKEADERTKEIEDEVKEEEKAKEKAAKEKQAISDAHMKAIDDAQRIEERKKNQDLREAEQKRKRVAQEIEHAETQLATQESSLLGQAFGEQAQFLGKQALGRGLTPAQVQRMIAQEFMKQGVSAPGARKAAEEQMDKIMVDVARTGGLAASLILQQGKLQRAMLERQHDIESQLMQANGDLRRNWDTAFKRGR